MDGFLLPRAYKSVTCRARMQARVPLLPGRSSRCSPRNAALCPPGRTEHVVGVSTAQPFPAACFLEKEDQQSPQRNQGDGGFSWGPPCPQQVDRLSFSKPGSGGQGSRAGLGVCPQLRLQQADREGQRPRQGSPGTVEAGGPSCGHSADARRCFTFASEFSRCSEFSQCWGE